MKLKAWLFLYGLSTSLLIISTIEGRYNFIIQLNQGRLAGILATMGAVLIFLICLNLDLSIRKRYPLIICISGMIILAYLTMLSFTRELGEEFSYLYFLGISLTLFGYNLEPIKKIDIPSIGILILSLSVGLYYLISRALTGPINDNWEVLKYIMYSVPPMLIFITCLSSIRKYWPTIKMLKIGQLKRETGK